MENLTMNQFRKEAQKVCKTLINFTRNNFTGVIKKATLIAVLLLFNVNVITPGAKGDANTSVTMVPELTKEQLYVQTVKDKMRESLVNEVDRYIKSISPNAIISAEHIVKKCIEYETDIIFVLAQGLLESHFGTKGKASETNSVWNVGTYDNGTILYTYNTPDESIEPYLKLVNDKYLTNVSPKGDTIHKDISHLLQDRGYINYQGKRFASARGYENGMRKLMIKIDTRTSIKFYQGVYNLSDDELYSFFHPEPIEINYDQMLAQN